SSSHEREVPNSDPVLDQNMEEQEQGLTCEPVEQTGPSATAAQDFETKMQDPERRKITQEQVQEIYRALIRESDQLGGLPDAVRKLKEKKEKRLTDDDILFIHIEDEHRPASSLAITLQIAGYQVKEERVRKIIVERCKCRGVAFNRMHPKKKESLRVPLASNWEVDMFYLPWGNGVLKLGSRKLPEHDSREAQLRNQGEDPYEMVCNSHNDSLTLPAGKTEALLFRFETQVKVKPTEIFVSDNHVRGKRMLGHDAIRTQVPILSYYAPEQATATVGPLSFLYRALWYDLFEVGQQLALDKADFVEMINAKMACIPTGGINFRWLLPDRQSQYLL
ncbi:unnamed protein product, partial [Amoebophrya sp. A25]